MVIIFYFLLMLRVGRCTDDQIFETVTVGVGDDVTLTCPRQIQHKESSTTFLFWIRLVSGNLPEFLGGTAIVDYDDKTDKKTRITAKQGHKTFLLDINKTKTSDTGVYYCIKVIRRDMTLLKGKLLRIKGPEPDITAVIQDFPSDPVRPGDSVTLQCSVLSDSEKKTCPEEHSVFWFRARSDESHPSLLYAHGNIGDECERSPEARSPQKCVYSFTKNVSSSDAGMYYCAVASCGEILFGNGTKLDIEVVSTWDSQDKNTIVFLLCAALTTSLIATVFLVYAIRKKSCDCCNAAATLQTITATASDNQQMNEDSLVYCKPNFTTRKAGKAGRRNARKEETIYTDVRAFVKD